MDDCPRVMTKEQIIAGLKAGKTLCIDRRDAPEHRDIAELIDAGLVTAQLVEIDDQSSIMKIRWRAASPAPPPADQAAPRGEG